MVKVILNGAILAESDTTEIVEGNHYFPPESVQITRFFTSSDTSTVCPWKGTASYYNADVNGTKVDDIAWYYREPKEKASNIKGYIAFYKNKVDIEN